MISKYCDVKQEVMSLDTGESPLTSFSQLMNDEAQEGDISRSPEKDSGHKKIKYIIPEDLPIDLRVKFAICLIHLRQLHAIKVWHMVLKQEMTGFIHLVPRVLSSSLLRKKERILETRLEFLLYMIAI